MGQTLSAPITEKHSSSGHDKRFAYGASAMQGWRISIYLVSILSLLRDIVFVLAGGFFVPSFWS